MLPASHNRASCLGYHAREDSSGGLLLQPHVLLGGSVGGMRLCNTSPAPLALLQFTVVRTDNNEVKQNKEDEDDKLV